VTVDFRPLEDAGLAVLWPLVKVVNQVDLSL
jgi:hypothetical protein